MEVRVQLWAMPQREVVRRASKALMEGLILQGLWRDY
jgi:hypothetical protein